MYYVKRVFYSSACSACPNMTLTTFNKSNKCSVVPIVNNLFILFHSPLESNIQTLSLKSN